MSTKRLLSLDIAKGICIILVVIGHYAPANAPEWYLIVKQFIYSFHMPLFIFASGYVYAASTNINTGKEYGKFIHKKFNRLLIPYFTTSILIITLKLLTQGTMTVDNPVTGLSYLKMFYLPEAGYFLWFVWALFLIFLFVPLFRTRTSRTILFAISLFIAFIPIPWPEICCIPQAVKMLKYFMLGIFLFDHKYWIGKARGGVPAIYPILALPVFFVSGLLVANETYRAVLRYLLPFIGIYSTCVLSIWITRNWSGLTQKLCVVASSSFIIYLFHTTFEGFAKSVIQRVPVSADTGNSLYFTIGALCVVGAGVLFPILLHRYVISRNQVLRFLFGLKPATSLK